MLLHNTLSGQDGALEISLYWKRAAKEQTTIYVCLYVYVFFYFQEISNFNYVVMFVNNLVCFSHEI